MKVHRHHLPAHPFCHVQYEPYASFDGSVDRSPLSRRAFPRREEEESRSAELPPLQNEKVSFPASDDIDLDTDWYPNRL